MDLPKIGESVVDIGEKLGSLRGVASAHEPSICGEGDARVEQLC